MRKLLLLPFLFAGAAFAAWPPFSPSPTVEIQYTYPTNELSTNISFTLYTATDVAIPTDQWDKLTNVVGTNLSIRVAIQPGQHFFFITASNFWGEGPPSEVVSTPPLPRSDQKLSIQRLP